MSFRGIVTRANPFNNLTSVFHIVEFAPAIIFVATYGGSNHSLSIILCPYRDLWSSLLHTMRLPSEESFMLFSRIPGMVGCLRFSRARRVSHDCCHKPDGERDSILLSITSLYFANTRRVYKKDLSLFSKCSSPSRIAKRGGHLGIHTEISESYHNARKGCLHDTHQALSRQPRLIHLLQLNHRHQATMRVSQDNLLSVNLL